MTAFIVTQLQRVSLQRGLCQLQHTLLRRHASAPAAAALTAVSAQKLAIGLKYLAGAGVAWWAASQDSVTERTRLTWLISSRLARDVMTATSIVAGEEFNWESMGRGVSLVAKLGSAVTY